MDARLGQCSGMTPEPPSSGTKAIVDPGDVTGVRAHADHFEGNPQQPGYAGLVGARFAIVLPAG